jgi:hypothetical protein
MGNGAVVAVFRSVGESVCMPVVAAVIDSPAPSNPTPRTNPNHFPLLLSTLLSANKCQYVVREGAAQTYLNSSRCALDVAL